MSQNSSNILGLFAAFVYTCFRLEKQRLTFLQFETNFASFWYLMVLFCKVFYIHFLDARLLCFLLQSLLFRNSIDLLINPNWMTLFPINQKNKLHDSLDFLKQGSRHKQNLLCSLYVIWFTLIICSWFFIQVSKRTLKDCFLFLEIFKEDELNVPFFMNI